MTKAKLSPPAAFRTRRVRARTHTHVATIVTKWMVSWGGTRAEGRKFLLVEKKKEKVNTHTHTYALDRGFGG